MHKFLTTFALFCGLFCGLTFAASAQDSSQGLTWTAVHTTTYTGQPNAAASATPGNTTGGGNDGWWTDENGANWNVSGGLLGSTGVRQGQGLGDSGALDQAGSQTALNQRIKIKALYSSGLVINIALRNNPSSHQLYMIGASGAAASNYYFSNYQGGFALSVSGINGSYTSAIPAGDYYLLDASAVSNTGGTSTTLSITVTDLGTNIASTTGTVVYTRTSVADSSAGVQAQNQIGVTGTSSLNAIVSLQTLNNGTPVAPALSAGTIALFGTVPLSATVTTTAATGGTAPYTYALYRSLTPLFTPGPSGTLAGSQSAVAAGTAPAAITDTTTTGKWWYRWLVTDSASATASTPATAVIIPDRIIRALVIGDSKIQGDYGGTVWMQYATLPFLNTGGTGYTTAAITVTNPSGFTGRSAAFTALLDGSGHVTGAYPTDRGTGYTASVGGPTLTVTGNGTGAAFAAGGLTVNTGAGGGVVLAAEQMLAGWGGGYHQATIVNGGLDGARSASFVQSSYLLAEALAAAGPPSACPVIMSDVGVNDAGGAVPIATYKASELARTQYLVGLGYICVLNLPYGATSLTDTQNDAMIGYRAALQQIAATDPAHIKIGVTNSDLMAAALPSAFYASIGDLHPSSTGIAQQGANIAQALAPLLGLSATATAPLTLTVTAGVNSQVLTWTADAGAVNGYEIDWKPSSALPLAGQVKSITAIVAAGVVTWTDTSAYRLSQSGRYNVVSLH